MISIVAVIRVKPEHTDAMADALAAVVAHVEANEPGTIEYLVSRSEADPGLFFTYERYENRAAMDLHNNSEAVATWVETAGPMLDGDVEVHICAETATMQR